MGLDAAVYCDCQERGRLRTQPRPEWMVYITECGARETGASDLETQEAFDDWNSEQACEHEEGVLLAHWIGNMGLVEFLRTALHEHGERFPLMLDTVVYSGSHTGDCLTVDQVRQLVPEVEHLAGLHSDEPAEEQYLRQFEQQMRELVEWSLAVGKPLAF